MNEKVLEEFERKWLGANICFGCTGGCAISSQMMEEMVNDISQALEQKDKEWREKVKSIVPEAQNEEFCEHDLESAVTPNVIKLLAKQVGHNACRAEIISKIEKL